MINFPTHFPSGNLGFDTVTMDQKTIEEIKPKLTRSRARRLRRKRLIIARKTAETNSHIEVNVITKIEGVEYNSLKIDDTSEIAKLNAQQLKKKNKIHQCQSNVSPKQLEYQSINSSSNKSSEESPPHIKKSRMELIENEKNLAINIITNDNTHSSNKFELDSDNSNSRLIIDKTIDTCDSLLDNKNNDVKINPISLNPAALNVHDTNINRDFPQLIQNDVKMNNETKTREQIKAEREAKKAAKAAMKIKNNTMEKKIDTMIDKQKNLEMDPLTIRTSTLSVLDSDKKSDDSIIKNEGKSKAELRTERRLKQEAQRAAKQAQLEKGNVKIEPGKIVKVIQLSTSSLPSKTEEPLKNVVKKVVEKESCHEFSLFKHLYNEREQARINVSAVNSNIHPAIIRLGVQYENKIIVGSNARCIALLAAVKQLIADFDRPAHADFNRGFEASLQESASYLHHCRPMAVSMQNALRHLKWQITQLPSTISDDEAKSILNKAIDVYIQEQIILAAEMISRKIRTKISNGDVILTYGFSSLIEKILCEAHSAGRQFRVVIVDGRPWLEGKELLRRLVNHGIECSYVLINALSFIMPEATKVFFGAHAILANGAVMARAGTAQVALMAKAFNVPVLVACEMHKSSERVQTDSIVYNEIDNNDRLIQNINGTTKKNPLANWRTKKLLNLLNITYDVTPANLVTGVVTELAILPCSSVPVILRIKPFEI